jgi:Raf kinase inhibitor-like YbhB/YbcL family protein
MEGELYAAGTDPGSAAMKQQETDMRKFKIAAIAMCTALSAPGFAQTEKPPGNTTFCLTSPRVEDGGMLPVEFTGDGEAATLPLNWSGAPAGTECYAVIMHHIAPDQTKWYWILYNIPSEITALPKNVPAGIGTLGNNSVNGKPEYAPPHSKGPGPKTYIYTVYALSAPVSVSFEPEKVSRDVLLAAMQGKVLARAELKTVYERKVDGSLKPQVGK